MSIRIHNTIREWQDQRCEIGIAVFYPTEAAAEEFPFYELPPDAVFIGLFESDGICVLADDSVVVYDHEVAGRVICRAAKSQDSFVSAIKVFDEFIEQCHREEIYGDPEEAFDACDAAINEAGGEPYSSFYRTLFGT